MTNKNCLSKADKGLFFTKTEGDLFFVTIQNSDTFNLTEYNDDSKVIIKESEIIWRQYSFTNWVSYLQEIQRNNLVTHDSFLNLGQSQSYDYLTIVTGEMMSLSDKDAVNTTLRL